jgi:protein-disulfide isomerase
MSAFRERLNRSILVLALFLALGGGWFGWKVWSAYGDIKTKGPDAVARERAVAAWARRLSASPRVKAEGPSSSPFSGSATASVRLVEFVDYGCPFCRDASEPLRRALARQGGDVFFQVRDFPVPDLHLQAPDAALAARCVWRQGDARRFWAFYDALFATQGQHTPEFLRARAGRMGASLAVYDACISARAPEADIQASVDAGIGLGIRGTPTFFLNGVMVEGVVSESDWDAAFQAARAASL